ncbi:unnamed protein product, partial [Ectocarpus sp. 4 AP-2014]
MFRVPSRGGSRDPLLPHSGNGRSGGGGLYGRARSSPKAALSKSFVATMVWALLSMSMIGGGWVYCSRKMESTRVLCEPGGCKIEDLRAGETTVLMIPRHKMVRGELVRVKNGDVVDPIKLRRSAQRKLGHSYNVVYLEPDSEDDDDESYDSFEDDDDSYDSYDGDDDSSEEDDDDDYDMAVMAQRAKERLENAIPPAGGTSGAKAAMASFPSRYAAAARREAELARKDAQRAKWAKDREERGLPPIKEPDEQRRQEAKPARGVDFDDEERFPGDAATMREKNRREIRNMEEARGMTAEEHRERGQQAFEEAAKAHKEMQRRDQQMRQMGNNLHDRAKPKPGTDNNNNKLSPDDPDNNPSAKGGRPPLERGQAQKDLNVNEGVTGGGGAAAGEDELRKGGGRTISSVGGLEEFDSQERRRLSPSPPKDEEKGEEEEEDQGLDEDGGIESFGDVVQHAGAAGSRRKLLSWKNRVKEVVPKPSKPTKEELDEDASKSRETHRQGHGHHQKRARKVAQPTGPEERADGSFDGEPKPKTTHHHKAFHHKEDVPQADRHHVHPGFHHRPGDKKIEHGWKHQHRQWHHREELKKLGTPFSLGRTVARKRKEAIDSYVSRRVSTLDFTDSKKWRAGGLWLIIVGCISIAFCIVIGNFQPR